MDILGIDIATTLTRCYIQQVEFDDTRDRSIDLRAVVVESLDDIEIDTRSQGDLIVRRAIVHVVIRLVSLFPLPIGFAVALVDFQGTCRLTLVIELHVGCDGAKEFHHIIDTEVTAMGLITGHTLTLGVPLVE